VRKRRAARGLLGLVLAAAAWSLTMPSAPPAAAADPPEGPVRVVVESLEPRVPRPGDTVSVSGRLTNTGADPLTTVTAQLRVSRRAITGRDQLAALATSTDRPPGAVVEPFVIPVAERLDAGSSAPFRLEIPVDSLRLGDFGVYPMAVEVRGTPPSGVRDRVGTVRTFLPWAGRTDTAAVRPTRVAMLWPVLAAPARGAGDLAVDDPSPLPDLLARRLSRVVEAGQGSSVTWFLDGDLLESADALGQGEAGASAATAAAFVATLDRAVGDGDAFAVGYADPDLVSVVGSRLADDLATSTALGPAVVREVLGRDVGGTLAWPADGTADGATLEVLGRGGTETVVLSDAYVAPVRRVVYTPDAVGRLAGTRLTAAVADSRLSALLTTPLAEQGGSALARQRFLAEVAMVTAERPSDGRSVLVVPPRAFDPDPGYVRDLLAALREVPWARPVTLSALLADPGDAPARRPPDYPAAVRARELPGSRLAGVATARDRLAALAEILEQPEPLVDGYERALLRTESAAWRDQPDAGERFTRSLTDAVTAARSAVRIVETGPITLATRNGAIPVTIVNGLDQPVTVRVGARAIPSVRLTVGQPPAVTVEAGRRVSVEVPAQAAANGRLDLEVRLLTPSGAAYGDPVTFPVRVTGFGQVARVVVGAALVLLGLAVLVRIGRALRRGGRRGQPR